MAAFLLVEKLEDFMDSWTPHPTPIFHGISHRDADIHECGCIGTACDEHENPAAAYSPDRYLNTEPSTQPRN